MPTRVYGSVSLNKHEEEERVWRLSRLPPIPVQRARLRRVWCACGCGGQIPPASLRRRNPARFLLGHGHRGVGTVHPACRHAGRYGRPHCPTCRRIERTRARLQANPPKPRPLELTPEQLAEAARLHSEGETYRGLASKYGVGKSVIHRYLTKHPEGRALLAEQRREIQLRKISEDAEKMVNDAFDSLFSALESGSAAGLYNAELMFGRLSRGIAWADRRLLPPKKPTPAPSANAGELLEQILSSLK